MTTLHHPFHCRCPECGYAYLDCLPRLICRRCHSPKLIFLRQDQATPDQAEQPTVPPAERPSTVDRPPSY